MDEDVRRLSTILSESFGFTTHTLPETLEIEAPPK